LSFLALHTHTHTHTHPHTHTTHASYVIKLFFLVESRNKRSVKGVSYLLFISCMSTRKRIVEHDVVALLLDLPLVNLARQEGT